MYSLHKHENRVEFRGVLTFLDVASDSSPAGSRGHKVLLPKYVAKDALHTLIGMGINIDHDLVHHNRCNKCGIITTAEIIDDMIIVQGYIFALDFKGLITDIKSIEDNLGMSYELHNARIEDMKSSIWVITKTIFVGAAVLLKTKAAYKKTSFCLTDNNVIPCIAASSIEQIKAYSEESV